MKRQFLACILLGLSAYAAEMAVRPGSEVSFSIAAPGATSYGLTRVQKDGRETPVPANMSLDPATGAFSWTPTVSQTGHWTIWFFARRVERLERFSRQVVVTTPPIVPARDRSEVARRLRQWFREGTASGNTGDFYDNRDRGHSRLDLRKFPQLDTVTYTETQRKANLDWSLQLRFLYPHVTFGNSSTASGDMAIGSNARRAMLSSVAMSLLYRQYTHNHLYIYPEHRDHDPGRNGRGGYGDLFPANIPYLLISQGSSGSDRPFMEAVAYTLAAFRPETKKRLAQAGLLMPTVQMILRSTYRDVQRPEDYLTWRAHPTALEGGKLDVVEMVEMAHGIKPDAIPPLAQIEVLDEDVALLGRDYLEAREGERLFDTPCAIARIARSVKRLRRMVVSARPSFDPNRRPLTYHWAIIRGDPERITIKPLDEERSRVELTVAFHERRPVHPGAALESNRVDIAAFVHNGAHYSPPAFISIFFLDSEARTYDGQGRIREVKYGAGESTIGYKAKTLRPRDPNYDITDWPALLGLIVGNGKGLAATLLREKFNEAELAHLRPAHAELLLALQSLEKPTKARDEAAARRRELQQQLREAEKTLRELKTRKPPETKAIEAADKKLATLRDLLKGADKLLATRSAELRKVEQAASKILTATRKPLGGSIKTRLEAALNSIREDTDFFFAHFAEVEKLAAAADPAHRRPYESLLEELTRLDILRRNPDGTYRLTPLLGPKGPLTHLERDRLAWLNATIMNHLLYPRILKIRYRRNYVNPFISTPRDWRDVYHYDASGRLTGWTRYEGREKRHYTPDGALVVEWDKLGRPLRARTVRYVAEVKSGKPYRLVERPGETIRRYAYSGPADRLGHVAGQEK